MRGRKFCIIGHIKRWESSIEYKVRYSILTNNSLQWELNSIMRFYILFVNRIFI